MVDVIAGSGNVSTTETYICLNACTTGSFVFNRIGNRIRMKKLKYNWSYYNNAGVDPNSYDAHRLMIVYDRQPNKALPSAGDLLLSYPAAGGAGTTDAWAFLNPNNRERFVILKEWFNSFDYLHNVALLDTQMHGVSFKNTLTCSGEIDLTGLDTTFNAGAMGTIADINTGSLLWWTLGNVVAADAQFGIIIGTRLEFIDA